MGTKFLDANKGEKMRAHEEETTRTAAAKKAVEESAAAPEPEASPVTAATPKVSCLFSAASPASTTA